MAPMVHGLEAKYAGRIKFSYLDADDARTRGFQQALGFRYQPEFYLVDANGELLHRWVGYVSAEQFEAVFSTLADK
jgi:thioredoxin-related protein